MSEKNLEIKIRIKSTGIATIEIYEPESGEFSDFELTGNREQEDREIMNEIRSWLEILRDEKEEEYDL